MNLLFSSQVITGYGKSVHNFGLHEKSFFFLYKISMHSHLIKPSYSYNTDKEKHIW